MGARPAIPAVVHRDRLENAIRRQVQAQRMAQYLEGQRLDPTDVYAEELRNGRRAAALLEAEAWGDYARRCSDAFEDAAAHEMGEVTPLRLGQDERRARYDADDVA